MAIDAAIYERNDAMRSGSLIVTIDKVDNEATVVLNGTKGDVKGPKGFHGWQENLAGTSEKVCRTSSS